MATTVQRFFAANIDQDQAYGTNVKQLDDVAGSVLSTTVNPHPSAAGTTTYTATPFTSAGTSGDDTTNKGWAVNEASADGMQSTASAKRVLPAGTWGFFQQITIPAGGTATGTHNVIVTWKVYRVATGAGARTLLFSAASAEFAGTALGVTAANATATSSQSEFLLEAGETIHVGVQTTDRQVAGVAGAVTAGNITLRTGGAADAYVEVATPGVRTRSLLSVATAAAGVAVRGALAVATRKTVAASGAALLGPRSVAPIPKAVAATGVGATTKSVSPLPKAVTAAGVAANRKAVALVPKAVTAAGVAANRKAVALVPKAVTAAGAAAMARTVAATRSAAVTAVGVLAKAQALIAARSVAVTAAASTRARLDVPAEALNRIAVAATPDWPLTTPTKAIAGVTRNAAGAALGSVTVRLVRQVDDVRVATTTSDATTGAYTFTRGGDDPYAYYLVSFKADVPEVHGVSDRGLVPA